MIWYCYKKGSHIVCRSKEGLLIRGIPEQLIFEVNASNRTEAIEKAAEIINAVKENTHECPMKIGTRSKPGNDNSGPRSRSMATI